MKSSTTSIIVVIVFFLSALLFVSVRQHAPLREPEKEVERGESDALKSFEWWYAQRALPYDTIPREGFERAARYVKNVMNKSRRYSRQELTLGSSWNSLGPANIGGRILAIAVDQASPNTVWAGAASGGLWKTSSGGTGLGSWSYVNTGFNTVSVSAIAIDPTNHNVLYIGTGEISLYHRPLVGTVGARASYGMGVLKSTDDGSTWTQTALTFTFPQITAVEKIVINPRNTRTVYAATSEGVYKSTDRGGTWTVSDTVLMAMDIVINPVDTTVLYASHGSANSSPNPGIYKSTNAGASWTQLTNGLPASNFGRTALAISPTNPSIVYAGITDAVSFDADGLYRTTDAGTSWSVQSTLDYVTGTAAQGWYNNVVAVHPQFPDTVYCGGYEIYSSTNGGSNLAVVPASGSVHVDQHAIAFDPTNANVMYFGCDGGIWKTTDGGASFINVNNSLVTTQFYPGFAVYQADSVTALGGLQDNGTLLYSGAPAWQAVYYNDGGWCAIDPTNKNNKYAESQYGDIERTTGGVFHPITTGLPFFDGSNWNFLSPLVISPSSPNVLYVGASNVYKTTSSGEMVGSTPGWAAANGSGTINGTNISCIGVSWTSPDTVLAGTGNGALGSSPLFEVYRSVNGGKNWTKVSTGLPNRYPTDIEFDPTNSSVVYLTYSGYGTSHLFRSADAGLTWSDISTGLPDIPHQSVTVDPILPQHIYVGTDLGVFHSSDAGGTWEEFNEGMPPAMVLDLVVSRANSTVRAATFGNGIYERPLVHPPVLTMQSPLGGEVFASGIHTSISWTSRFIGALRLEFSSDNGATWNLIADGVPALPSSYTWAVPAVNTTQGRVRISDSPAGDPADSSSTPFSILVNPDVLGGWNMVSVPLHVADPSKSTLFPSAISRAFTYVHAYIPIDTILPGVGYWIKFDQPQFVPISGDSIATDTISVLAGWNMIGSIASPVATSSIIQIPGNNTASYYFGYSSNYLIVDTIRPRGGYWIKVNADGKLVLTTTTALFRQIPDQRNSLSSMNSLIVRDAEGRSMTLYFTDPESSIDVSKFELPPVPPDDIFDVRFGSQRFVETLGTGKSVPILIQSTSGPLTLSWNITDSRKSYVIQVPGGEPIPLTASGSLRLTHPEGGLTLQAGAPANPGRPGGFALQQNYPNPFNPSTLIRYTLPTTTHISIKVFDILGNEVAVLVDGNEASGQHEVRWDPGTRASGIYFCRMQAAGFSETKKLLFIR